MGGEHCNGGGCLPNAEMAYRECGWCAGVGRVHVGCTEESYADLVAAVRERDNTIARIREVLDDYDGLDAEPIPKLSTYTWMHEVRAALDPQETP